MVRQFDKLTVPEGSRRDKLTILNLLKDRTVLKSPNELGNYN